MQVESAAGCMESLGNPNRLEIFRQLVRAGRTGLAVGSLGQTLNMPGSTLTHHIQHLVQRGLVTQTREGRVLRCTANFDAMLALVAFLTEECCADEGGCC